MRCEKGFTPTECPVLSCLGPGSVPRCTSTHGHSFFCRRPTSVAIKRGFEHSSELVHSEVGGNKKVAQNANMSVYLPRERGVKALAPSRKRISLHARTHGENSNRTYAFANAKKRRKISTIVMSNSKQREPPHARASFLNGFPPLCRKECTCHA